MKKAIEIVFFFAALGSVLATAGIYQHQLDKTRVERSKISEALDTQGTALQHAKTQLQHAVESLNCTAQDLANCRQQSDDLAARLQTSERLAGLLECEVGRLMPLRKVTAIVVHHSESTFGDVPTIDAWHRERGWDSIGYHYVICNGDGDGENGEIQFARNEDTQGAHAKANHRNVGTIGVCLIGTTSFTPAQLQSLQLLLRHLCRRHGLTAGPDTIQHHHEQCPGAGLDLDGIIASVPLAQK